MDRREQIRKYFEPLPRWTVLAMLVGVLCLYAYGLGLILIGLGVWGIVRWRRKPDDVQLDGWLQEDLDSIQTKALAKAGSDPAALMRWPVMVTGPRLWNTSGAAVAYRKGKDGRLRFTPIAVAVLNFTVDELISYECALDLTTGATFDERSSRCRYAEIVSASTRVKSEIVQIQGKATLQLNAAETFEIVTSQGTPVEIMLRDPSLIQMMGGGEIPTTRVEEALQALASVLSGQKVMAG